MFGGEGAVLSEFCIIFCSVQVTGSSTAECSADLQLMPRTVY